MSSAETVQPLAFEPRPDVISSTDAASLAQAEFAHIVKLADAYATWSRPLLMVAGLADVTGHDATPYVERVQHQMEAPGTHDFMKRRGYFELAGYMAQKGDASSLAAAVSYLELGKNEGLQEFNDVYLEVAEAMGKAGLDPAPLLHEAYTLAGTRVTADGREPITVRVVSNDGFKMDDVLKLLRTNARLGLSYDNFIEEAMQFVRNELREEYDYMKIIEALSESGDTKKALEIAIHVTPKLWKRLEPHFRRRGFSPIFYATSKTGNDMEALDVAVKSQDSYLTTLGLARLSIGSPAEDDARLWVLEAEKSIGSYVPSEYDSFYDRRIHMIRMLAEVGSAQVVHGTAPEQSLLVQALLYIEQDPGGYKRADEYTVLASYLEQAGYNGEWLWQKAFDLYSVVPEENESYEKAFALTYLEGFTETLIEQGHMHMATKALDILRSNIQDTMDFIDYLEVAGPYVRSLIEKSKSVTPETK